MRIVFDVDGVIAYGGKPYAECRPYPDALRALKRLKKAGHTILYHTARYMLQFCGDQEMARAAGEAELVAWLDRHGFPNDGVSLGKPSGDVYVDDLAFKLNSEYGPGEWDRLLRGLDEADPNAVQVGDVVELKSGSPPMTVTNLVAGGKAEVSWFDSDSDYAQDELPVGCLNVTERRWQGFVDEELGRAASTEDDDSDDSDLDENDRFDVSP